MSGPKRVEIVEAQWSLPVLPALQVSCPDSLAGMQDAVAGGARCFAGGTDILVQAAHEGRDVPPLAWIGGVDELGAIEPSDGSVRVGSGVTLGRVAASMHVRTGVPAVADAASIVGSVQIRNVATLAGNLCNASPAADTVPALFVHDANVEILSRGAEPRIVAVEDFSDGPGRCVLADSEIVTWISVRPLRGNEGSAYRRFTVRNSMDLAFVGVAARVELDEDAGRIRSAKVALGAVAPTVIAADEAASVLVGTTPSEEVLRAAGRAAAAVSAPIGDVRASRDYRLRLVEVMTRDVVLHAWRRAKGSRS